MGCSLVIGRGSGAPNASESIGRIEANDPGLTDPHNILKGIALAALSSVAFGTLAVIAKLTYRVGAQPVALLAARFAFAAVLLSLAHLTMGRSLKIAPKRAIRLMLLGGLGYASEAALFFLALDRSPASVVSLIFYSYPLWTGLMAFATRLEPFRWRLLAAFVIGFSGVAMIFSLPAGGLAGPLLALAAAVAVAVFYVVAQVVIRDADTNAAALWTATGAMLALTLSCLILGQGLPAAALPGAAGLGVATAVAFTAMYAAIARIGSSRATIAALLEPITTVLLAALFLAEALTWRVALGTALVAVALPLVATSQPATR
jgi:drug/metabolite transporter (DMT)-like permease